MDIEFKQLANNSGLIAIWIAASSMLVVPFISKALVKGSFSPYRYLPLYLSVIGLALLLILHSRTGFFMCVLVMISLNCSKVRWVGLLSSLALIILVLLTLHKHGSTLGRLQILTITFAQLTPEDVSWFHGITNFESWYNPAQARYFSERPLSEQSALLADNNYFLFNDILQVTIERGFVVGIAILIGTLFYLRTALNSIKRPISNWVMGAHLCLISLLSSSLFYYTFQVWPTYLLVALASSVMVFGGRRRFRQFNNPVRKVVLVVFGSSLTIFLGIQTYYFIEYERKKEHASRLVRSGFLLNANMVYRELCNDRFVDGILLFCYAENLYSLNRIDSALAVINRSAKYYYSDGTATLKARIYERLKKFEMAEQFFKEAVLINPKSFRNRLSLILFYDDRRNVVAARHWAQQTLLLTEKVPSERSAAIKSYIRRILVKIGTPML